MEPCGNILSESWKPWWFNRVESAWYRRIDMDTQRNFVHEIVAETATELELLVFRNKNYGFTGKETYPLQVKFSRGRSDGDPALRLLDTQPSPSLKHL